jgi:tetratricopeptide (TPR) repeat protein
LDSFQYHLVALLTADGRTSEVESHYREAIEFWKGLASHARTNQEYRRRLTATTRTLANLLLAENRAEDSKVVYQQVIPLLEETLEQRETELDIDHNDMISARHELAIGYQYAGRAETAIELFRRALDRGSNAAKTYNALAWQLATCGDVTLRDPEQAAQLAERAVSLMPKSATYHNTLAAALYRRGDYQAAAEALQKSLELASGGHAFDWFLLAMVHHQLGDAPKAQAWLAKAESWLKSPPANTRDWNFDDLYRLQAEARQLLGIDQAEESEPTPAAGRR